MDPQPPNTDEYQRPRGRRRHHRRQKFQPEFPTTPWDEPGKEDGTSAGRDQDHSPALNQE